MQIPQSILSGRQAHAQVSNDVKRLPWSAILSACCLLTTVALVSCSSEAPDLHPLMGSDAGLVELDWGEGPDTAGEKMLRMNGLDRLADTIVVLKEEPLFISADSVVPPRIGDLSYRQLRFNGGAFFGYQVEQWQLWFSDDVSLRNVDIIFSPQFMVDELYNDLGDRLLMIYGVPERGGIVWKKYRSRNWSERHVGGEEPGTGALLTWGRIPGQVTLSYHDLLYTDSLEQIVEKNFKM